MWKDVKIGEKERESWRQQWGGHWSHALASSAFHQHWGEFSIVLKRGSDQTAQDYMAGGRE